VGIAQADGTAPDASGGSFGCDTKLFDEQFFRCPSRGAVALCGRDPDQHARRGGGWAVGCDFFPPSPWRALIPGERAAYPSPRSSPHAGFPPFTASSLLGPLFRRRRRPDVLWA